MFMPKRFVATAASVLALVAFAPQVEAEIPTVTLRIQDYSPPSGPRYEAIRWWMDEVTERSGGRITFQEFFGASMVPAGEALSAVSTGLADVGMINAGLHPSQLPLHTMGSLPFGAPTFEAAGRAWMALYDEFPEMTEELERQGVVALTIQGTPSMQLRFRDPVNALEDVRNRRVRTFGLVTRAVEVWGGVPVSMPFPEIYEGLRLGTIDGAVDYLFTVGPWRLHEVAPHFVFGNFGAFPTQPFIMNKRRWDELGPEAQAILLDTARESFDVLVANFNATDDEALGVMEEAGNVVVELSEEERAAWLEAAGGQEIWAEWATELDGVDADTARAIADRFLELASE